MSESITAPVLEDIYIRLGQIINKLDAVPLASALPEHGGMALARKVTGYCAATIRAKCEAGEMPHTRDNRNYRFDSQLLALYMAGQDTPANA